MWAAALDLDSTLTNFQDELIKDGVNGSSRRMTRPYVYHAKGMQRLKNFALQTLAACIENMIMHKWMLEEPAIPQQEDYQKAWIEPQKASVLVWNPYNNGNPEHRLSPPQPVPNIPAPPEVAGAFDISDKTIQSILGSYDSSLGINDNQLSGIAIVEGATQSNAAAMPYIVGNLLAKQQLAEIFVDLLPKLYVTPRTIPVTGLDGKSTFQKINQQGGVDFNYDENVLQVKVEAGVNFQVQKHKALQQIIALKQSSEQFSAFINEVGLEVLLDNVEIRGIDHLKQLAGQWMKSQAEQKKQAMEMKKQEMMNNPQMIRAQIEEKRLMFDAKEAEEELMLKANKIGVDQQNADTERLKAMAEIGLETDQATISHEKAQAENTRSAVDMAIKVMEVQHKERKMSHDEYDMHHRHAVERKTLHHKVNKESK